MQVTIVGPVFDASGYAEANRTLALALRRLGVGPKLRPADWSTAPAYVDAATQRELQSMVIADLPRSGVLIFSCIPDYFRPQPGCHNIGLTMLECDRVSARWVAACNAMDEIWVPSTFNRDTFIGSGVDAGKVHVMPLGVDPDRFHPGVPPLSLPPPPPPPPRRQTVFLSNFEWIPRKGYDILISAYLREFRRRDPVCLVIKAYSGSRYDPWGREIRAELARISASVGNADPPPIVLISRALRWNEMPSLYTLADCFVLPTRGEGFNLPALEAMACGRPVITTNWSAHLDFVTPDNAYLIPIDGLEEIPAIGTPNDPIYAGALWARPNLDETRRLMRHVAENPDEAREKGRLARAAVEAAWTASHAALRVRRRLQEIGG